METAKLLLRSGADLELEMPGQWRALHLAALASAPAVQLLARQRAEVTCTEEVGALES